MKTSIVKPLAVLSGILGTIAVMAGTNVLNPVIQFIHHQSITPFESLICIGFTLLGFAGCYLALNTLCTYFVPRIESKDKHTKPV